MSHFVYMLRCSDGSLYTGYTTNITKRLQEHNGEIGSKAGARYTRGRRPVFVVYTESYDSRSEALKRESAIKALSRAQKLLLVELLSHNAANEITEIRNV